jgi:hypothetical protein
MSEPAIFRADDVRAFWQHLTMLCAETCPPKAADLDLMDFYKLAPFISLLDIERPSGRLRVRFAGTAIVEMFGRDATGRYKDDLNIGRHTRALVDIYDSVISERRPYWSLAKVELQVETDFRCGRDHVFDYERIACPLVDDDGTVVSILTIIIRHPVGTAENGFQCMALDFPTRDDDSAAFDETAAYS